MKDPKKVLTVQIIFATLALVVNAVLLGGAVWLIVKVLQWTGVL